MRQYVLFLACLITFETFAASDSLVVQMNKSQFKQGDTIELQCLLPGPDQAATLQLWADHIETGRRWKFRYPFINGVAQASLVIGKEIPDGHYAFNFLVQKGYFRLSGQVENHEDVKDQKVNMMMLPRNKAPFSDEVTLNEEGRFRLKSTLFEDSAYFVFTPTDRKQKNNLQVKIEAQIDSSFVPLAEDRVWVTIGNTKQRLSKNDSTGYVFNMEREDGVEILPGVTVTGKSRKKVEQYEAMYTSQLFNRSDARTFDGLEDDGIATSYSILRYLEGRVGGLTVEKNQETNVEIARWRGEPVQIFVDEFPVSTTDIWIVSPSDVAMIKVYSPPANLSILAGAAGAIAIYTKRGEFANRNKAQHKFAVKGYNPSEMVWN